MWYIYAKYYSTIKRNEIESVEVMWMNLELVIQTDISQKEKNDYCILTHIYMASRRRQWHPHSSTLAWKIPWMEEPGRLQSMGSLRVGHD